ncbi:MAG: hypothetical protein IT318_24855 [Anaerolineales bacterium]|nr:hypothetical protein [Anaerolineales bacterium]
MSTDISQPVTITCAACQRRVPIAASADGTPPMQRCTCGVLLVLIEETGEDGLPIRRVVTRRRAHLAGRGRRKGLAHA